MSALARLRHRKQTLLFLLVVLLPSTALAGLALHLLGPERQWERHEWEEARRRAAAELGRALGLELERIRLEEQGRLQAPEAGIPGERYPALVLAARQRDGRLILPWEDRPDASPSPAFVRRLAQGARAEFGGDAAEATAAYQHAAELAPDEESEAAARLALARVLGAAGSGTEAVQIHASLLALPTLDEVVAFYIDGGRPNPHLAPGMRPLSLSPEERRALVAYLEALTGTVRHP